MTDQIIKIANNTASLTPQTSRWGTFYDNRYRASAGRYPTEWVVRTLAGGNYPGLKIDKSSYQGARILDMGCGDGRNLPLLLDLGFEVHASEISPEIVSGLESLARELQWPVRFVVGLNAKLPYPDHHFDCMLCCASCYYLDGSMTWTEVHAELARVLKPGGLLVANIPDEENFILTNSIRQPDGSLLITSDPYGLRNGIRFMAAKNAEEISALLAPQFQVKSIGHQNDDYYGIRVTGYFVVAQRL
jgi:SAM-dependent methyltransferase